MRAALDDTYPDEFLAHADWLGGLARHLARDDSAADDLVQSAWVSYAERPPAHRDNLRAWLRVVVRNLAFRQLRDARRRNRREAHVARPEATDDGSRERERDELRTDITDRLQRLSEPYRTVLVMRYLDGLEPREIAQRLDRPLNTVQSQHQRGLRLMRERLDRDYGGRAAWVLPLLAPLAGPVGSGPAGTGSTGSPLLAGPAVKGVALVAGGVLATTALLAFWDSPRTDAPLVLEAPPPAAAAPEVAALTEVDDEPWRLELESAPPGIDIRRLSEAPVPPVGDLTELVDVAGTVSYWEPIAGADIFIAPATTGGDGMAPPKEWRRAAVSDAFGRFRIEDVEPFSWIWADKDGMTCSYVHRVDTFDPRDLDAIYLNLREPVRRLDLRVIDPSGAPVENALIAFPFRVKGKRWGDQGSLEIPLLGHGVRTDAHGRVRVDRPCWRRGRIMVHARGKPLFAEVWEFDTLPDGELTLQFPEPARLVGHVTDRRGEPVAGATVEAFCPRTEWTVDTTTDGDGRYVFRALAPERLRIRARAPRPTGSEPPRPTEGSDVKRLTLTPGEDRKLDLRLGDGFAITGSVAEAGMARAGWRVIARTTDLAPRTVAEVETDGGGTFRLDVDDRGPYTLFLFDPADVALPRLRLQGVARGDREDVELGAHPRPRRVTGQIAGGPDDRLVVELLGAPLVDPLPVSLEGSERAFELDRVPAGSYELVAQVSPHGRHVLASFDVDGREDIDLGVLGADVHDAALTVRCVPADGEPVRFTEAGIRNERRRLRTGSSDQNESELVLVEGNTLRIPAAPPGEYLLELRSLQHQTVTLPIVLEAGEETQLSVSLHPGYPHRILVTVPNAIAGEVFSVESTWNGEIRDLSPLVRPMLESLRCQVVFSELAEGRHDIRVRTSAGRVGELALDVVAGTETRVVELPLE